MKQNKLKRTFQRVCIFWEIEIEMFSKQIKFNNNLKCIRNKHVLGGPFQRVW